MISGTSTTKRRRRTKAEIAALEDAIFDVLSTDPPMTVRQVFYRLVAVDAIEKAEREYKNVVCRLLLKLRRNGRVPYEWIVDNTRWMRKPRTYDSVEAMLQHTVRTYRRALWQDQPAYVEIWLEKDALAGLLMDVTDPWDVPLLVARGFSSESYAYEAAQAIKAQGKPAYLYYFGDHDPSGKDIDRDIENRLRRMAPNSEIHFERVGVTLAQVAAWNLPTRPTKKTDSRSKNFEGESVEVDAIPPDKIRALAEECIMQHINAQELERHERIEQAERESFRKFAAAWSVGHA